MIAIRTFNCWAYTVRYRARCGTHDGENKKNGEKKRKELECACVAAAQRSSLPLPAPPVPFFFLGSLVHRPLHLRVTCAGTRPATSAPPRPATSGTGATNTHTQTPSPDFGRSLNGGTLVHAEVSLLKGLESFGLYVGFKAKGKGTVRRLTARSPRRWMSSPRPKLCKINFILQYLGPVFRKQEEIKH